MRLIAVLVTVLAMLCVLGQVTPAYAAAGSIQVTVVDNAKDPLPGATVTLSDPQKQFPDRTAITDPSGVAHFAAIPPSTATGYVIKVTMVGYSSYHRANVPVQSNQATKVTAPLLPEKVEQVTVRANAKVVEMDTERQTNTTISAEEFSDLPVFGRDYQAALPLAAGVQDNDADGNPNVLGARDRDFKTTVDGVSNVDPLTGRFQSNVNPDSIEEIDIVTTGADASYGGATGGFNKMTLKSGGNKFAASFNMLFADSVFDQNGAGRFGQEPVGFRKRQPAIVFSGPVIRDKLWFLVSHEMVKESWPIFLLGGQSFPMDREQWRHADKLTWQVTPKNKLQFSWRSDPTDISPFFVDSLHPAETGAKITFGGPATEMRWTAPFSPSTLWETTVAFSNYHYGYSPYRDNVKNSCVRPTDQGGFDFLGDYYCRDSTRGDRYSGTFPENWEDKRKRWTYELESDKFIDKWLGGSHHMKFGAGLQRASYERDLAIRPTERLSSNGVTTISTQPTGAYAYTLETQSYYFPGQVQAALGSMLREQRGTDTSLGNYYHAFFTDTYEPRPNLSLTAGFRFSREELSSDGYRQFIPNGERTLFDAAIQDCVRTRCEATCAAQNTSGCRVCVNQCVYQRAGVFTLHPLDDPRLVSFDGGDPTCSLALNSGLCNQLVLASGYAGGYDKLGFRQNERFTIVNNNIAPRFKIAWDPRNDGKTKISATAGRYYGDTILLPLLLENGPDWLSQRFALDGDLQPTNADPNSPTPNSIYDSAFSVRMIDRNLKTAYNDEYTLQVEREVAAETAVRLTLVSRNFKNQLQQYDMNHRPITTEEMRNRNRNLIPGDPSDPTKDCPQVRGMWDCTGLTAPPDTNGGPLDRPPLVTLPDGIPDTEVVNPYFNEVFMIGNYNSSTYRAVILELQRRMYQNWEMNASYTYSRARGAADDFEQYLGSADLTNVDLAEGPLGYDQPHVFKLNGRVLLKYLGGIRLGGVATYQSGLPYSIVEQRAVIDFPTDLSAGESTRLQQDYGVQVDPPQTSYVSQRTIYVTNHRNDRRNPAFWQFDVNLQKEFNFKNIKSVFEFHIYNLLNEDTMQTFYVVHQRIAAPGGNYVYRDVPISAPEFGRRFEIAMKVSWN